MQNMRQAFGKSLIDLARKRNDFVVLDADVAGGTGVAGFRAEFPDRFIQCGIAEQNMFSAAAGIAASGLIPVVACYAFAALRALEQIRNSIAYPDFPVKIVVSHLGVDVGPDGATHQAIEDIGCFRAIPNINIFAPADPVELEAVLPVILDLPGPAYMRTGRSPLPPVYAPKTRFEPGKANTIHAGEDVAILAVGVMVWRALESAKILEAIGISARVLDMAWLKPMDQDAVISAANECGAVVTCEDHNKFCGLGSAVAEILALKQPCPLEMVALDDCFGESGNPEDLSRAYGLMPENIANAAKRALARKKAR